MKSHELNLPFDAGYRRWDVFMHQRVRIFAALGMDG